MNLFELTKLENLSIIGKLLANNSGMRREKTSDSYSDHVNLEYLWMEKIKGWKNWINTRIKVIFFNSWRMVGRMAARMEAKEGLHMIKA